VQHWCAWCFACVYACVREVFVLVCAVCGTPNEHLGTCWVRRGKCRGGSLSVWQSRAGHTLCLPLYNVYALWPRKAFFWAHCWQWVGGGGCGTPNKHLGTLLAVGGRRVCVSACCLLYITYVVLCLSLIAHRLSLIAYIVHCVFMPVLAVYCTSLILYFAYRL
jgi:hypothetical protein